MELGPGNWQVEREEIGLKEKREGQGRIRAALDAIIAAVLVQSVDRIRRRMSGGEKVGDSKLRWLECKLR